MAKFTADINNAEDGWIQVTISGPTVSDLTEAAIEAALSAALSGMAEPVAWRHKLTKNDGTASEWIVTDEEHTGKWWDSDEPIEGFVQEPLFAAPPVSDLREENERLRKALETADAAIAYYVRYLDGGEMRGSYDGKPERDALRRAGYATRAALQTEGK